MQGAWFALNIAQLRLDELAQALRRYREEGTRPSAVDLRWMDDQWKEAMTALRADLRRRPLPGQAMLPLGEVRNG